MAETNIIASNDLWSRIKTKFGFPGQSAAQIIFENRCMMIQDIADFMNHPVIDDYSFGTGDLGLYWFAEVPVNERWKVRAVSFESAAAQIDSIRLSNGAASPNSFDIDSFVAAGDHLLMYDEPIILDAGWKLAGNVTTIGTFFVFLYYEREIIG